MASIVKQWLTVERVLSLHLSQNDGMISPRIRRNDTTIDESQAVVEDWGPSDHDVRGDSTEVTVPLHRVSSKADRELLLLTTEEIYRKYSALDEGIVYMAAELNTDQHQWWI